jgi:hypothetical protein
MNDGSVEALACSCLRSTYGWALAPVSTPSSAASTLVLWACCFCWSKNATSTAVTSIVMPAMRNDPCRVSTNAWLIAWCSADGGRGSRTGAGNFACNGCTELPRHAPLRELRRDVA